MKNFLFSRANREIVIFIFFLALAGAFWLMMRLNDTFEKEVTVEVRYVSMDGNIVLTSNETDTLHVTISDKGFNILSYVYGQIHRPHELDITAYTQGNGTGTVGTSEIKSIVAGDIPASAKVVAIKPDRLTFYYNNGESKRVPVLFGGTATPQSLYFIAEKKVTPDSVTIYASRQKLDSIKAVYTEERNYSDLRDTLTVTNKVAAIKGVKIVPNRVNVTFVTDVLAEVRIENIPIEGINMPPGKVLRTFPTKTGVSFVTGMKNYNSLKAGDFRIVADYMEFSQDPEQKCNIHLAATPEGVSNARPDVTQVDYLIEEARQ